MGNRPRVGIFAALVALIFLGILGARRSSAPPENDSAGEWPYYGHDAGGMRYSPLTQISRENVSTLKVAWTFHTGEISDGRGNRKRSGFEATPILVDGTLFFTTGFNRVIAVNPETGKLQRAYDPKIDPTGIMETLLSIAA